MRWEVGGLAGGGDGSEWRAGGKGSIESMSLELKLLSRMI